MTYRLNAFGRLMSTTDGIVWTTLPPKAAKHVLFSMERAALIGLIHVTAVVVVLPALASVNV